MRLTCQRTVLGAGLFGILLLASSRAYPLEDADLEAVLKRQIIGTQLSLAEVQAFCDSRVAPLPRPATVERWDEFAKETRKRVLERVVFRGEAAKWRDAKTQVEWLDTIEGGPGYKIKKLRYEAIPGLWIPALLYEPEKLAGKTPVMLAVNGHDGAGKAAPYKQIRCINLAKRGMLALNVEWFGMGQLAGADNGHGRINELDLCGTSGVGAFYLAMKRGIDILLAHPNADPERVAVSGLSGGGWQTIFISALDTRVTLTNPVAGYSSYLTRSRHFKDLGDSEQTPNDLAANADYTHLTAMMAPRPTLLTFNSKDNCCFESGYALPPLAEAAAPIFELYGHAERLRKHENHDPGDHNYGKDNREAFYRMLQDHFFAGAEFDAAEIPSDKEVKKDELSVALPEGNLTLHAVALSLAKNLPRDAALPRDREAARKWQETQRAALRSITKLPEFTVAAVPEEAPTPAALEKEGILAASWRFKLGDDWTVPVVELAPKDFISTTIVVADGGRAAAVKQIARLLSERQRVLALDPFYFGESKIITDPTKPGQRDWLFAILVASGGERPLGIQAGQVAAVARWSKKNFGNKPVSVLAVGPRSSLLAFVATAVETDAIGGIEVQETLGSLKEVLEANYSISKTPEVYCFGLLERFDVLQIAALCAPRPITSAQTSQRALKELEPLEAWYRLHGSQHVVFPP